MRLTVVLPGPSEPFIDTVRRDCARWTRPDTELEVLAAPGGPPSLASRSEMARAAPAILDQVTAACRRGTDGIFIDCAGDPAVEAAREIADVPVAGAFEPALLAALSLGRRVGVLSVLRTVIPIFGDLIRVQGLEGRCTPVRVIDAPVLELHDRAAMVDLLYERARAMVDDDRSDVLVLGCTGFIGVARVLQDRLAEHGPYVPVIDPTGAALQWLQTCVRLGVRPSRAAYAPPPEMTWKP
ncbi:aspartate/glutamate racemase family protein [Actinomadura algeriensis]|uniref:Allantoin racemase n=1 Tax=Actinomadura algeriensis TaxID=1679523 RepID=A0ABR9K482_9ACTN|nr:aspartate/glutamate racemase family protein [Actinomadura algeriensis]MBE1537649.1 allantoin racemase [Actinomadura algeriensis]